MNKIETLTSVIKFYNMKKSRDKRLHREAQLKKDEEIVKNLVEIKKELMNSGKED